MTLLSPGTYTTPGGDTLTIPAPPAPLPTPSAPLPQQAAPPGLVFPSGVQLFEPFTAGKPLNEDLWSPTWFGNQPGKIGPSKTYYDAANAQIGPSGGLFLILGSTKVGGIVSSNPSDGVHPSGGGFQIAPSPSKPVYVEFVINARANAAGVIANWPVVWLDGQEWPTDGEIDAWEANGGWASYHTHYSGGAPGANVNQTPGAHVIGVLWSATGQTFIWDGKIVGVNAVALTSPQYIILQHSLGAGDLLPAEFQISRVLVTQ